MVFVAYGELRLEIKSVRKGISDGQIDRGLIEIVREHDETKQ